ncbi:MAG: glycoside hydrolase family 3 domain protein [Lacunisphaera sp.]|nr:glycoside hydrolase family 3 domain protein [Lacunisphaera sp.]
MRLPLKTRPAFAALGALAALALASAAPFPYEDPALPVDRRVDDLLGRMTLGEKVGQMCQYLGPSRLPKNVPVKRKADDDTTPDTYGGLTKADILQQVREGRIGSFLNFYTDPVAEGNELQQAAAGSRLKIPLLFGADAIHGHAMTAGTTVFPVPIGLAATFDEKLVEQTARVTALEMRATGFQWAFAPNVEVARDQRWGRVNETFGEDPLVVARLGVATVHGLQGKLDNVETDVLACAKHFLGGSQPVGGQNHAPADFSERTLREVFLPPFAACVNAGALTLMVAHNEVNGVPAHANHYLLTEVLKQELGFKGFAVSDWLDVSRLWSVQHIARDMAEASELAVAAGLDMHMHGPGFYDAVVAAVQAGRIPADRVDDAVRRILRAKFAAGLFEHRLTAPALQQNVATAASTALALEAARKSIVLLRNEGDLLPLKKDSSRVFLTGPDATGSSALGDWATPKNADRLVTVKSGIEHLLGAPAQLDYFECGPFEKLTDEIIRAAATKARGAAVAVLVVGGHPNRGGGPGVITEGENSDRADLDLPGRQLELVQAVQATGVPTVVVLFNGGAICSPWLAGHVPAIVEAFYPGQQGGRAVAEVLFGDVNPSGKLPYTVPRGAGFLPGYYYQRPGYYSPQGRFSQMTAEQSKTPLYPFGFGLSYTTFAYSNLTVPARLAAGQDVSVSVDVTNTGRVAGEEVVLAFISDLYSSVTVPVKLLKDFQRVSLAPGETKTVALHLPADALALYDVKLQRVVEPGEFAVTIGDRRAVFTVTP